MTYVVCQTSNCKQTYPTELFKPNTKAVDCRLCGGALIDKDGGATYSKSPDVLPVLTIKESEKRDEIELHKAMDEFIFCRRNSIKNFAVYDNLTDDITFQDTYVKAKREYEDAKKQILEDIVTGDEQVFIFEVKKVANLVVNKNRQEEAKSKGYDNWIEWDS